MNNIIKKFFQCIQLNTNKYFSIKSTIHKNFPLLKHIFITKVIEKLPRILFGIRYWCRNIISIVLELRCSRLKGC